MSMLETALGKTEALEIALGRTRYGNLSTSGWPGSGPGADRTKRAGTRRREETESDRRCFHE